MPRPKPAQPELLKGLIARIDTLLNLGVITKDFAINSLEAAYVTGLSVETVRRYARSRHIPCIQYAGRNLYPLKALCEFVDRHYREATVISTSDL
jgi:hypothetical protein